MRRLEPTLLLRSVPCEVVYTLHLVLVKKRAFLEQNTKLGFQLRATSQPFGAQG